MKSAAIVFQSPCQLSVQSLDLRAMAPGDIAFKSNFATLNAATGVVERRRADRKFEHLGPALCAALDGLADSCGSSDSSEEEGGAGRSSSAAHQQQAGVTEQAGEEWGESAGAKSSCQGAN